MGYPQRTAKHPSIDYALLQDTVTAIKEEFARLDRMIDEMREEGIPIDEDQLKKIYGPVGLEIGAETAEEIALSIIAEIKAVLAGKPGRSLREKQDVIHSGNDTVIEVKNLH